MKTSRIICSIMLLLLGVALVGCSHKNAPDQELIEGKGKDFTTLSRSKAVDVVAEPYVGVKAVPIRADEASQAELNTRVMLRKRGTLSDIAATITDLTALTVQVGADPAPISKGGKPAKLARLPPLNCLTCLIPEPAVVRVYSMYPMRGLCVAFWIMWQSPVATGGISTPRQKPLYSHALSCGRLRFWVRLANANTKIRSPTNPGKRRAPVSVATISTRR